MQAVVLDDPFHAAATEDGTGLDELLGNDLGRSVRIEKAMADNVAHHLVGPAVVVFGAALLGGQAPGPLVEEALPELKVALPTEAELSGGSLRSELTFPFEQHRQPVGDGIGGRDRQCPGAAHKGLFLKVKMQQGASSVMSGNKHGLGRSAG